MTRQHTQLRSAFVVVLLIAGLGAGGCSSWSVNKLRWPWQEKEEELTPPERIVSIWTDTVLHQPGAAAIRGFGARVLVYGAEESKPIKVDGTFIVYAFDADHIDPSQQKPLKKFVFPADGLESKFSESDMGPSYSLWCPWDTVGGPALNISLVTRFEGREGGIVISEPVTKLLPGTGAANSIKIEKGQRIPAAGIQPVDYQQPVDSSDAVDAELVPKAPRTELESDAIDLPPAFIRRLQKDGGAEKSNSSADAPRNSQTSATRDSSLPISPSASAAHATLTTNLQTAEGPDSPGARSEWPRFPARTSVGSQPVHDPMRKGPHHAGWPSALPATPRFGWSRPTAVNEPTSPAPADPTTSNPATTTSRQ